MPVLIVDDDPDVRDLVRAAVEADGLTAITADDGFEALRIVETMRPSIILLDVQMPGMDGWNVLREVRFRGFDTPVVIVSGTPDIAIRATAAGATAHLAKPFRITDLIALVRRHRRPVE